MSKLNVLVIEDELDILEDLPALLGTYGFSATATGDFDRALSLLGEREFNCVILDLKMPPGPDMTDEETESGRTTGILVWRAVKSRPVIGSGWPKLRIVDRVFGALALHL